MAVDSADPVRYGHDRLTAALRDSGVDVIVELSRDDCVWMPPNDTSLYGKDEVREWFEEYFESFRITVLEETERQVIPMGDWVYDRWSYAVAIVPLGGGERIRDDGRAVVLWQREADGDWRISQLMFNSIRPIGSGTSRFMVRMMERRDQARDGSGQGD